MIPIYIKLVLHSDIILYPDMSVGVGGGAASSRSVQRNPLETLIPHNNTTSKPACHHHQQGKQVSQHHPLVLVALIQRNHHRSTQGTEPRGEIECTGEGLPENMCSKVLTSAQLFLAPSSQRHGRDSATVEMFFLFLLKKIAHNMRPDPMLASLHHCF